MLVRLGGHGRQILLPVRSISKKILPYSLTDKALQVTLIEKLNLKTHRTARCQLCRGARDTRHGLFSRHRWHRNDRRKSNEPGDSVISRSVRRISIRVNGGEPVGRVAARQSMQTALRGYSLWSSRPTSARTTLSTTSFTAPFPIAPLGPFCRCPNRPKMSTLSERGHPGSVNEHRTCQSKLSRESARAETSTGAESRNRARVSQGSPVKNFPRNEPDAHSPGVPVSRASARDSPGARNARGSSFSRPFGGPWLTAR